MESYGDVNAYMMRDSEVAHIREPLIIIKMYCQYKFDKWKERKEERKKERNENK